jgi:2-keto-3-deoxy-L-fuconate dehydrogenase
MFLISLGFFCELSRSPSKGAGRRTLARVVAQALDRSPQSLVYDPRVARLGESLVGKRVLVTQAREFMGPALVEVFREHGATVSTGEEPLTEPGAAEELVRSAGEIDVLVANLSCPAPETPAAEVGDDEWRSVFAHLVDPLPRLLRAVLPQMTSRGEGKVIVMGSASALRGIRRASTYSAARGAQIAYVRAVGTEVAPHGVQVNLIAQNFVENDVYFPEAVRRLPMFQERMRREVPAQRLGTAREDAMLAVFLASDECCFMVGQTVPFAGGWVT